MEKSILADTDKRTFHIGQYRYRYKDNKIKFNNVHERGIYFDSMVTIIKSYKLWKC